MRTSRGIATLIVIVFILAAAAGQSLAQEGLSGIAADETTTAVYAANFKPGALTINPIACRVRGAMTRCISSRKPNAAGELPGDSIGIATTQIGFASHP